MKFSEFLTEHDEVSLIGKGVSNRRRDILITPEMHDQIWEDNFICVNRGLTTLKGAPKHITGMFECSRNYLTSLKYGPEIVDDYYDCSQNNLTSLEGAPKTISNYFTCSKNNLTSLEGAPKTMNGHFFCTNNKLTSLKDIHKIFTKMDGDFYCGGNPIRSHVLGLLLIDGLTEIISNDTWDTIVSKYLGKDRKGMLDCQNELIEAGYEEYAQI